MNITEAMQAFKPPFPVGVMEWKVQATNKDKTKGLAAPYADTRAYEDRLNEVVPADWTDTAAFMQAGDRLICTVHLTVLGVTRAGDGESPLSDPNAATVAYAQAFKRACSRFGLGRYLYDLETGWMPTESHGRSTVFTGAALNQLRAQYQRYTAASNGQPVEPERKRQEHATKQDNGNGLPHWIDDDTTRERFWAWTGEMGLSHDDVHWALGGVESVKDFAGDKAAAVAAINQWVQERSERPFTED
ncbi:MAG: hypothetical protein JXC32_20605 [Anaerolineae bacterium]|nr:hypothetical protein [Anaerolineae bacterium]